MRVKISRRSNIFVSLSNFYHFKVVKYLMIFNQSNPTDSNPEILPFVVSAVTLLKD